MLGLPHVSNDPAPCAEIGIGVSPKRTNEGRRGYAALMDRIHENELGCIKQFLKFVGPLPADDTCWRWEGGTDTSGYGVTYWNHQRYAAHRLSYELFVGQIMPGLCVCHTCDNPRCVKPGHLWLGTHADNMRDLSLKGRGGAKASTETETFISASPKRSGEASITDPASTGIHNTARVADVPSLDRLK